MTRHADDPVLALPVPVRCRRLRLLVTALEHGGLDAVSGRTGLSPARLRALLYDEPLQFTDAVARALESALGSPHGLFDRPPRDLVEVGPLLDCRARNLRVLAAACGGAAAVARRCGVSAQVIRRLLKAPADSARGDMPDGLLRRLEQGCDKPIGWMDERHPDDEVAAAAADLAQATLAHERACRAIDRARSRELAQAERLARRLSTALVRTALKAEAARERAWLRSIDDARRALDQDGEEAAARAAALDHAMKAPVRLANATILWHEAGCSWQAVARRCDLRQGDVAVMLARGVEAEDADRLERGMGKPAGWMHQLHESAFRAAARALSSRFDPAELAVRKAWMASRTAQDDRALHPVRRDNLALLVLRHGGTAALSRVIDRQAPMVSMWARRHPGTTGGISADSARHIEACCGLPDGWMDQPRTEELVRETACVEVRRQNLRRLLKAGSPPPALAEQAGVDARKLAMLVRAAGGTPMPADLARRIEAAFGKRPGYLDRALAGAGVVTSESRRGRRGMRPRSEVA